MTRRRGVAALVSLLLAVAMAWWLWRDAADQASPSTASRRPGTVETTARLARPGQVIDGPAIVSREDDVAVVWIERTGDTRRLVAATSANGAATFDEPVFFDASSGLPPSARNLVDVEISGGTTRRPRPWWRFDRSSSRSSDLVVTVGDTGRGAPVIALRLGRDSRAFEPVATEPPSGFSWASQRWPVRTGSAGETRAAHASPPRALQYVGVQTLVAPASAANTAPVVALDGHGALYAIWQERDGAVLRRYGVDWVEPRPDTVEFDVPVAIGVPWPTSGVLATATFAGGAIVAWADGGDAASVVTVRRVWLDLLCKPPSFTIEPLPTPTPPRVPSS